MHDLVVRDLEQARNRTLGPTDLDDPHGGHAVRPAVEPAGVGPGARAGQKPRHRLADSMSAGLMRRGREGAAGERSCWRGSGRWPTAAVTARSPPAGTSAASMAGTSDGADWSNGQDWQGDWDTQTGS